MSYALLSVFLFGCVLGMVVTRFLVTDRFGKKN